MNDNIRCHTKCTQNCASREKQKIHQMDKKTILNLTNQIILWLGVPELATRFIYFISEYLHRIYTSIYNVLKIDQTYLENSFH